MAPYQPCLKSLVQARLHEDLQQRFGHEDHCTVELHLAGIRLGAIAVQWHVCSPSGGPVCNLVLLSPMSNLRLRQQGKCPT